MGSQLSFRLNGRFGIRSAFHSLIRGFQIGRTQGRFLVQLRLVFYGSLTVVARKRFNQSRDQDLRRVTVFSFSATE